MTSTSAVQTYSITGSFEKTLKLVRRALEQQDLCVAAEYDLTDLLSNCSSTARDGYMLLVIDSPLLLFEAMARDRATATLIPAHLLLSGGGDQTEVVFVDPAFLVDRSLPAGAWRPLQELTSRIGVALESASAQSFVQADLSGGVS